MMRAAFMLAVLAASFAAGFTTARQTAPTPPPPALIVCENDEPTVDDPADPYEVQTYRHCNIGNANGQPTTVRIID